MSSLDVECPTWMVSPFWKNTDGAITRVPVVIISSLTQSGSRIAYVKQALSYGAIWDCFQIGNKKYQTASGRIENKMLMR